MRAQHRRDVAVGVHESLRHALDQLRRRIVGDEVDRELPRDEARAGRLRDDQRDGILDFRESPSLDPVAEQHLGAEIVAAPD